jgi:hypothetical protein
MDSERTGGGLNAPMLQVIAGVGPPVLDEKEAVVLDDVGWALGKLYYTVRVVLTTERLLFAPLVPRINLLWLFRRRNWSEIDRHFLTEVSLLPLRSRLWSPVPFVSAFRVRLVDGREFKFQLRNAHRWVEKIDQLIAKTNRSG